MLSDFEKYLPPDKAMQAFSSFEVTVNGTITKESVMKWVVDVYNERKSLSLTLNDNRTVIYNVNRLLDLVLSTFTWISNKMDFQVTMDQPWESIEMTTSIIWPLAVEYDQ